MDSHNPKTRDFEFDPGEKPRRSLTEIMNTIIYNSTSWYKIRQKFSKILEKIGGKPKMGGINKDRFRD